MGEKRIGIATKPRRQQVARRNIMAFVHLSDCKRFM